MMSRSFSYAAVLSLFACLPSASAGKCCTHTDSETECKGICDATSLQVLFPPGPEQRKAGVLQTTGTDGHYLHMSPLFDGIRAWTNLPDGSVIREVPQFLKHLPTTFSSWILYPETSITYSCPDAPEDIDVCDAWIFYYSCSECNNNPFGVAGGLAAMLTLDPDWEGISCAPWFTNGYSDAVHPMKAFRRQLAPGESAEVILPGVAEFLAFGIDGRAINCGGPEYNAEGTCPTATGRCKWEGGVCKNQNCARAGAGPAKPCPSPCPWSGPRETLGM